MLPTSAGGGCGRVPDRRHGAREHGHPLGAELWGAEHPPLFHEHTRRDAVRVEAREFTGEPDTRLECISVATLMGEGSGRRHRLALRRERASMLFRAFSACRKKKGQFSDPGPWPINVNISPAEAVLHPIAGFPVGPLPSKNLGLSDQRQIPAHRSSLLYPNQIRGKPTSPSIELG
jgi:hypothetical protein